MSVWRLEVLRVWRTRRLIVLVGAFIVLGLGDPILTYYTPELLKASTGGIRVIAPAPTPAAAIAGFARSITQIGTLLVVVVGAASLAIDARPALAAFYRTRVRRTAVLLLPRYLTVAVATLAALALGTLAAGYETAVLIGRASPVALAGGLGLEALWMCFALAVVTAWSALVRGVVGVVGCTLATLLALALPAAAGVPASWLPTGLAAGLGALVGAHHSAPLWHGVIVTAGATVLLLVAATRRIQRRVM